MEWHIPTEERRYLRGLAQKQAEYAALPVMPQRKQMWYDLYVYRPSRSAPAGDHRDLDF